MCINNGETILINRMFAGKYCIDNIGHEIINLFKTDNGENYIYINPYGRINKEYNGKIKYVLFTQQYAPCLLRVLAKVVVGNTTENEDLLYEKDKEKYPYCYLKDNQKEFIKKTNKAYQEYNDLEKIYKTSNNVSKLYKLKDCELKKLCEENKKKFDLVLRHAKYLRDYNEANILQREIIEKNGITYNGVNLDKIFDNNIRNEESVYFTFKAEEIYTPKIPLYIKTPEKKNASKNECEQGLEAHASKENKIKKNSRFKVGNTKNEPAIKGKGKIFETDAFLITTDARSYITYGKHNMYNNLLDEFINKEEYWEKSDRITNIKQNNEYEKTNIIRIMRKEYDELAFSNLFKYIFEANRDLFIKFAKDKLEVEITKNYTVQREVENIDLLISDNDNVIVIENKIKSGINGVSYDIDKKKKLKTQLDDYYFLLEKGIKSGEKGKIKEIYKTHQNKDKHYFIFLPNYSTTETKENDKYVYGSKKGVKYTVVRYRTIFDWFNQPDVKNKYLKDVLYFEEFLEAVQMHSKDIDNNLEEEMYRKFYSAIKTNL